MRFDAAKYPSVSWDAMTFVTGTGDVHEVPLLPHATVVSGAETPDGEPAEVGLQYAPPELPRDPLYGCHDRRALSTRRQAFSILIQELRAGSPRPDAPKAGKGAGGVSTRNVSCGVSAGFCL